MRWMWGNSTPVKVSFCTNEHSLYLGFAEKIFWRGSEVRKGNQNNIDNLKVYGF